MMLTRNILVGFALFLLSAICAGADERGVALSQVAPELLGKDISGNAFSVEALKGLSLIHISEPTRPY